MICKILKSLYGLKQAGILWNKMLIKFFRKISFALTNKDQYILTYCQDDIFIIDGLYVDDFALTSKS